MMKSLRRKHIFNAAGVVVVAVWLVMIGLLIKRTHFEKIEQASDINNERPVVDEAKREWMEIYLKDAKVGYAMTQINPFENHYVIWEEIVLRLNLMGQASAMRTNIRSVVDRDFELQKFTLGIESGIVRFQVSGKTEGRDMVVETGTGARKKTHRIELAGPPVTGSAMSLFFSGRPLTVGESFTFHIFDPSTLAQKEVVVKVVDRESVTINRIAYAAFRLETEMWGQKLIFWVDDEGSVLKEKGFMGLTLVRSSAATAMRDLEGNESFDFYEMASIEVQPKLRRPEQLSYLKLKAGGIDTENFSTAVLNSGRQRFSEDVLEITQERRPLKSSYVLPYRGRSGEMGPFLEPGFNVQSDDSAIVKKAHDIVGDAKDPLAAARKLMGWVFHHVQKRPVLSLPSAVEVLETRTGDCNEHAVLLTALLRAAGIPARECVGVVYANDRFFYHAWTEAYIGRWVSMDATMNQLPTDAAHIKLVEGGLDRQTDIIPLIGKLKLDILDYRHD